ncbi:MAG: peptide chain release factor N(5)-glutamine methyltransferase [Sulfurifustis sp.]
MTSTASRPLTLRGAIEHVTAILAATSPTARLDAEVLVRYVTGAGRADHIACPERPLSDDARARLDALLQRRRHGEPIAYLTRTREFWSLDFAVSPATLIPRPETELLVERALARIPPDADAWAADLGTGSGAIAAALAHERPQLRVVATDQSDAALAIARANADRLGLAHIEFRRGHWLEALGRDRFDVIVSNPPYVREGDPHLAQGDVRFEPRAALVGGRDGLDAIREIAAGASAHLRPGGWLLLEHGHNQGADLRAILARHGFREVRSYTDLAGHERVTEGSSPQHR